ncbi:MAG: aldo/keto reductase, partial [Acidobacteriota bacterium]|nr:aldo/keto reductase [Acidobacteriota bacterium]
DSLVRSGKVRYIGASSMAAWQFAEALFTSDIAGFQRFATMQNHYNLLYREEERDMIPLCLDQGVGLLPWSPLARGFLTGSHTRENPRPTKRAQSDEYADRMYFRDEDFDVVDALLEVARARGEKPSAIALAWLLSVPGVVAPIVGATRHDYIDDAVRAVEIELTEDEIEKLESPYRPHPILGHDQPGPREFGARGR